MAGSGTTVAGMSWFNRAPRPVQWVLAALLPVLLLAGLIAASRPGAFTPPTIPLSQALADVAGKKVVAAWIEESTSGLVLVYAHGADAEAAASDAARVTAKVTGQDADTAAQDVITDMRDAAADEAGRGTGTAPGLGSEPLAGRSVAVAFPYTYGDELTGALLKAKVPLTAKPAPVDAFTPRDLLGFVPALLIVGIALFAIRQSGALGSSRDFLSRRGRQVEIPDIRFADVIGADEAVEQLREVVDFFNHPDRYQSTKAQIPHGFLLVGPPGTGKTMLARAVAGEAGVPYFAVSGSDFVDTFVGVGARRVRDLFEQIRKAGDRAVVFIDEIDAVGRARGTTRNEGAVEHENTLNALLTEMDGFSSGTQIFVLAATNRPDILDPALIRPGRFDRQIQVSAPDAGGRTRLLEHFLAQVTYDGTADIASLARRTFGMTGASLAALVNDAALRAASEGRDEVSGPDLEEALSQARMGRARTSATTTERDAQITAWHEAGHALAALLQEHASDPVAVTIVPRGAAGGVTQMGGTDDNFTTKLEFEAQLVTLLAGRVAETFVLGDDFTPGAASDLSEATRLGREMVTVWGMGPGGVSRLSRRDDVLHSGPVAEQVVADVDLILAEAHSGAKRLLSDNEDRLRALAEALLERETLTGDDVRAVIESVRQS